MSIDQTILESAWERHQAGDLQKAELLYRKFLSEYPEHPQGLFLLGYLASQVDQSESAIELIQQAIAFDSNNASFYLHLGGLQKKIGALTHAVASYRQAIALQPDLIDAYNNLGNVYRVQGDLESAERAYRAAIERKADFAEAHGNLGLVLHEQHRYEESMAAYQRSLAIRSDLAEIHHNLGNLERELGKFEAARQSYKRAIQIRPDLAESHNNLGIVLRVQGDHPAAADAYRHATILKPDFADAYFNLASSLNTLGRSAEAVEEFHKALDLQPDHLESMYYLAVAYQELGDADRALEWYERLLQYAPDYAAASAAIARIKQDRCDWESLGEHVETVIKAIDRRNVSYAGPLVYPLNVLGLPVITTSEQQWRAANRWSQSLSFEPKSISTPHNHRRIRIGYLSADFREHPVGYLIPELIEAHDRDNFEIFGYSMNGSDGSSIGRRLENAFDHFAQIENSTLDEAARSMMQDQIDILVDLQGYTRGARTEIMALRPSAIQVNYLGYSGTMGAKFIDYILVDDFVVPTDQQPYFNERLVHLPGCFMVNDRIREMDNKISTRAEAGLPESAFVFCAFSSSFKITRSMFDVWMRLLLSVENSVLWLRIDQPLAVENLSRYAERCGVSRERLIFAPKVSMLKHLARHHLADLYLDTFPYNQHSTASDALRAGLPLVTLAGPTFSSRIAGSLLRAVGMDSLITYSFDEYETLARRLSQEPETLTSLRRTLEANLVESSLFDGRVFAKNIEKAFRQMWEIHRHGQPPRPLVIA